MNQTVALLLPAQCDELEQLRAIGREHGYFLVQGMENSPGDVRDGLRAFVTDQDDDVRPIFISTSNDAVDSWDVIDQLQKSRTTGEVPPFFAFIRSVDAYLKKEGISFYFVAASEWGCQDEAIFLSGDVDQLIGFLSLLKTFDLPLWRPGSRDIHETPRYPLIFEFHSLR